MQKLQVPQLVTDSIAKLPDLAASAANSIVKNAQHFDWRAGLLLVSKTVRRNPFAFGAAAVAIGAGTYLLNRRRQPKGFFQSLLKA